MDKYNIHLLTYKNKYEEIKKLINKDKKLIYLKDYNKELPIHIASRLGYEKIVDFFYELDNNILLKKNSYGDTAFHLLVRHKKISTKYLQKSKNKQLNIINNSDLTPLITYILENDKLDNNILNLFYKKRADINYPRNNPQFSKIILQKQGYHKFKQIFTIFKNIDINLYDKGELTPIFYTVRTNNLDFIKLFIENKADYNATTIDGSFSIFNVVLANSPNDIIEYFLTLDLDYNFTSTYGYTFLHTALFMLKNKKIKNTIINKLIEKTDINHQNIKGDTPIHFMAKLKIIDKFKDELYKKEIDFSIKNKNKVSISKLLKPKHKLKKSNDDDIKILKLNKVKKTSFMASIKDMVLYDLYIMRKYKQVGIPICKNIKKYKINKKGNNFIDFKFDDIANVIRGYNINLECLLIVWHNKELNFNCKNFKSCLENVIKKDIIIINLTLVNEKINHANIIIIDNKLKTIERFDPYGIIKFNDQDNLDNFIKKNVHNIVEKITKKKYEYLPPNKYLNNNIFQSLSQEHNKFNINAEEIGGLCLAWCFWYLESRLININVHPKVLIQKLNKKLINNKMSIIEYIRSYSSKIDSERNKLLKEFKFKNEDLYKTVISNDKMFKLYDNIYKELTNYIAS